MLCSFLRKVNSVSLQAFKLVSEYDQEIPQSQTADNPWHREEEPLNHHETPGRQSQTTSSLFPIKTIAILEWT